MANVLLQKAGLVLDSPGCLLSGCVDGQYLALEFYQVMAKLVKQQHNRCGSCNSVTAYSGRNMTV
jgi:hypothetical protein